MASDDINNRFDFHPPKTPDRIQNHEAVRADIKASAAYLDLVLPDGREKSLALTKLEEALFWANAAIARA
jgi:hypothetical protein